MTKKRSWPSSGNTAFENSRRFARRVTARCFRPETRLVERLLEAIATNRPCAYGPAEVAEAVEAGAVETLLVSDAVVRDVGIEDLMRSAESARGTVVLVSRHHEAGQKLEALGGI